MGAGTEICIIVFEELKGGGGGGNGEMANLTNEKGEFAIAIFRHFSPLAPHLKNQPATLCALYEQIFERTQFSQIINSENSWAEIVSRRV